MHACTCAAGGRGAFARGAVSVWSELGDGATSCPIEKKVLLVGNTKWCGHLDGSVVTQVRRIGTGRVGT